MRYAKLKILFQGLTISNFGVFRPIFGSEVSRWGFLRLRIRLESSKIRKSYQKYDFWQFFGNFRFYPLFLRSKTHHISFDTHSFFFHRSSDNIQKLLLDPKKVGVRGGEGMLPLNLKKKFTRMPNSPRKNCPTLTIAIYHL